MKKYIGNKNFSNVFPDIMNKIPRSRRYFSLFLGGGGIEFSEDFKNTKWIVSDKSSEVKKNYSAMAEEFYSDYKDLLLNNEFTKDDFILCDPPYMFENRKSKGRYYEHEFSFENHVEFLNYMISVKGKVMIIHPSNLLYENLLNNWNRFELKYMSRNGWFKDNIYTNYVPGNVELFNYSYLGNNRTDRQRMKRKRKNFVEKFKKMSFHEQRAVVEELFNTRV